MIFKNCLKYLFSHCSLIRVISLLRLLLSVSLRKGAGYLQAFVSVGRTCTAVVNLMAEDGDSLEKVGSLNQATQSTGCHESIVASKNGVVKNLVKTEMLVRRGH